MGGGKSNNVKSLIGVAVPENTYILKAHWIVEALRKMDDQIDLLGTDMAQWGKGGRVEGENGKVCHVWSDI